MPAVLRQNGSSQFITSVVLPKELHDRAKALDINVSETLREALLEKIDRGGPHQ